MVGASSRRLAIGLVSTVVASVLGVVPITAASGDGSPGVAPFVDVPVDHPFHEEIVWLSDTGVASGYEDGTFGPRGVVTRQTLAAFLYRYADPQPVPEPPAEAPFPDVGLDHPFLVPIAWMADQGLVSGYDDGRFLPTAPISRQTLAAVLHRLTDLHPPKRSSSEPTFPDVPLDHPFLVDIEWAAHEGIVTGYDDGRFGPLESTTRQAFAAFLARYDSVLGTHLSATLVDHDLTVDVRGCRVGDAPGFVTVIVFPASLGSWSTVDDIVAAKIAHPTGPDGRASIVFPDLPSGFTLRIEAHCAATDDLDTGLFSYHDLDVENPGPAPGPPTITGTYEGDEIEVTVTGCGFTARPQGYLSVFAVPKGGAFPPPGPEGMVGLLQAQPVPYPGDGTFTFAAEVTPGVDLHAFCDRTDDPVGSPDAIEYPVVTLDNLDPWAGRFVSGSVTDGMITIQTHGCSFGGVGGYVWLWAYYETDTWPEGPFLGFEAATQATSGGVLTVSYPVDTGTDVVVHAFCTRDGEPGPGSFAYADVVIDNPAP